MGNFGLSADGQSAEDAAKVTRRYEPLHAATPQRPSVAPKPAKPAAKHATPAAKHAAAEVIEAGGVAAIADKGRSSSARAQAQQRKDLEAGTESAAGSE